MRTTIKYKKCEALALIRKISNKTDYIYEIASQFPNDNDVLMEVVKKTGLPLDTAKENIDNKDEIYFSETLLKKDFMLYIKYKILMYS